MTTGQQRRVAIITGSRADFGLLVPVIRAIDQHPALEPLVIAAGAHIIPPALSFKDVKALFPVADSIPMQIAGKTGRAADVQAVAKGIARFGRSFEALTPHWVLVLGDRIEAFAAASAASIGGFALAHIHGGDRAEGVADEAMRHAISKLAHLHFAASAQSAQRLKRMGEREDHIILSGSPAIDDLADIKPLPDSAWRELGSPDIVFIMHPTGRDPHIERQAAENALRAIGSSRVLVLHPNHDPGRDSILDAIRASTAPLTVTEHLPRPYFLSVLARLVSSGGILVGNSSAALIEAAALALPAVNIGPRQAGRERPPTVIDAADESTSAIEAAIARARTLDRTQRTHPYGDGHAGQRIADALARFDPADPALLRKHNTY